MRTNIRIEGLEEIQERMNEVISAADVSIERSTNFIAQSTAQRAKNLIRRSVPAGNVHFRENPDRYVQASAPGQPPAIDTGFLINSISFTKYREGSGAVAFVGAEYGATLEFGDHTIAPRPFFVPAFRDAVAAAAKRFKIEFEALL